MLQYPLWRVSPAGRKRRMKAISFGKEKNRVFICLVDSYNNSIGLVFDQCSYYLLYSIAFLILDITVIIYYFVLQVLRVIYQLTPLL